MGASGVFKALEIMGESDFVKNNMSINTIFKLENLKKVNGSFKNRDSRVYFEREKKYEKKKRVKMRRKEKRN